MKNRSKSEQARIRKEKQKANSEMHASLKTMHSLQALDAWSEHPEYHRIDWRMDVAGENTQRGYWDWVDASIEIDYNHKLARLQ